MPTREADLRRELALERVELASAMDEFRRSANVDRTLRSKLPLLAAGAFAAGFVLAGGIGAVARLMFRRGREGKAAAARVGPFAVYRR
jgi:hypothetical protein